MIRNKANIFLFLPWEWTGWACHNLVILDSGTHSGGRQGGMVQNNSSLFSISTVLYCINFHDVSNTATVPLAQTLDNFPPILDFPLMILRLCNMARYSISEHGALATHFH